MAADYAAGQNVDPREPDAAGKTALECWRLGPTAVAVAVDSDGGGGDGDGRRSFGDSTGR